MHEFLDLFKSEPRAILWLDDVDYTDRLLAGGKTPWLNVPDYLAHRRKAQGLLKADIVVVPVDRITAAWVEACPELRELMAAKRRSVAPAKVLLADTGLRAYLVEVLTSLRAAFVGAPLFLAVPSPMAFVTHAWVQVFGDAGELEVGEDETDSCAVYLAEFLRSFGTCGVNGVLLVETAESDPADATQLGWYQPVINIAHHYRWVLGLRLPDSTSFAGIAASMQFVIAPWEIGGAMYGHILPAAIWGDAALEVPSSAKFLFASVPSDAVPEQVLSRLERIRAR